MLTTASRRERTHLEDRFAQRALPGIGGVGRTSDPAPDSRPGTFGQARCGGCAAPGDCGVCGRSLKRGVLRGFARTVCGGRVENGDGPAIEEPPGPRPLVHAAVDGLRVRRRPRVARWRGGRGVLFSGSLLYLLVRGDLTRAETALAAVAAVLVVAASLAGYVAYKRPRAARQPLKSLVYRTVRVVRRRYERQEADELVDRLADRLGEELRSLRRQASSRPLEVVGWCCLAFGYWVFDATCLVLVFLAVGVHAGAGELLVAYGIATAAGSLPLTPGGIGVFEATMLATLAVFGIGAEAAIPVLGYRFFNFWMPIPLAALIYPTLRKTGGGVR